METIYQLAKKGPIGKLSSDEIFSLHSELLDKMEVSTFTIGAPADEKERVVVFRSTEDLHEFERLSGVQLETPNLVMSGPEVLPKKEWPSGMATKQDPAVAAFLDFRSKPSSLEPWYTLPCNSHTRSALLALGVVPEVFQDVRDVAEALRSLHAGIEIFNAVLCLWRSVGMYPWEKDLNEAIEWLERADVALASKGDYPARLMIERAITEVDKLRLGNYGKAKS